MQQALGSNPEPALVLWAPVLGSMINGLPWYRCVGMPKSSCETQHLYVMYMCIVFYRYIIMEYNVREGKVCRDASNMQ